MGVLVSHATWFSHYRHENPQVAKTKILTSVTVSRLYGSRQPGKEKEEREEERGREIEEKRRGNISVPCLELHLKARPPARNVCVREANVIGAKIADSEKL